MQRDELEQLKTQFANDWNKYVNIKAEVGKRLLTIRKKLGYNQQEVAEIIGISRAALSYYEKGERSIDIEALYKLSHFYNISIDYLFGLKTTSSPEHSFESAKEMAEVGFSYESLDKLWGNTELVDLLNDLIAHKNFHELEILTYGARYTYYEEIDNGYRSFLTSKLLYSMMADIFKKWYIDNPDRIQELSTQEKETLMRQIKEYLDGRKRCNDVLEAGDYNSYFEMMDDHDSQLRMLYKKIGKYL